VLSLPLFEAEEGILEIRLGPDFPLGKPSYGLGMIPDEYHDFFLGAVTVAGALVGLLFVAISVRPAGVAGEAGVVMRVRAGAALAALLNAMFVSLIALLPGKAMGGSAIGIGLSGVVSVLTLLVVIGFRRRELRPWELVRMVVLVTGLGTAFVIEVVNGANLRAHPGSVSDVSTQAVLVIIFFALGVERAWEYVGGAGNGVLALVDEARRGVRSGSNDDGVTPS
jgi:hypothetical protein